MERGAGRPVCASLEIEHVAVDFAAVDLRIVPLYTVAGLFSTAIIHQLQQFFVAADVTLFDGFLDASIILNPQNYVPGLIVCPTVVGFVQQVGLEAGCGCHGVGCELVQCSRSGGGGQGVPPVCFTLQVRSSTPGRTPPVPGHHPRGRSRSHPAGHPRASPARRSERSR